MSGGANRKTFFSPQTSELKGWLVLGTGPIFQVDKTSLLSSQQILSDWYTEKVPNRSGEIYVPSTTPKSRKETRGAAKSEKVVGL